MDNHNYCEITPDILRLAAMSEKAGIIDTELFTKYEVKRGLRDLQTLMQVTQILQSRRAVQKKAV